MQKDSVFYNKLRTMIDILYLKESMASYSSKQLADYINERFAIDFNKQVTETDVEIALDTDSYSQNEENLIMSRLIFNNYIE